MTDYSVLKDNAEENQIGEITIFGNTVNVEEQQEKKLQKSKKC